MTDLVNHPPHYTNHPVFTGECHEVCRMLSFDAGNAVKYLWRWNMKGKPDEDLRKALWYINRTELPCRVMQTWDGGVQTRVFEEVARFAPEFPNHPVQSHVVRAITYIISGQIGIAAGFVRRALTLLEEGETR